MPVATYGSRRHIWCPTFHKVPRGLICGPGTYGLFLSSKHVSSSLLLIPSQYLQTKKRQRSVIRPSSDYEYVQSSLKPFLSKFAFPGPVICKKAIRANLILGLTPNWKETKLVPTSVTWTEKLPIGWLYTSNPHELNDMGCTWRFINNRATTGIGASEPIAIQGFGPSTPAARYEHDPHKCLTD